MLKTKIAVFSFLLLIATSLHAQDTPMVSIKRGAYVPLYGTTDKKPVEISAFNIDVYPVTNAQYLAFVQKYPQYSRSKMKGIFADKSYLSQWQSDFHYGKTNLGNAPVTNVSWFAAKKYCECQGKRLPTMDEWEYVAMADEKRIDARSKEDFNKYIMSWYEKPKTDTNPVGQTFKNYWGVYDMHGLVWEWTADFNSIFLSGESRKDKDTDKNLFCGSGSVNATDLMNYAAFMRYAFRGSLKARYTTKNLGFRCATDKIPQPKSIQKSKK
ncbi:formylglycine-generating enzyme family protein [Flavobacterium granuli]|uniref:Formylglycine-generating enzyme required for sulfatase activity n=1 Tax=Flavobacterium granuli TaxID=280093 RepID=A0A1M5S4Z8_9FLAO|nr:formylglycine-generating enzyme family protein [Flavobacterium granuli]PRZ21214.1 formylglycine-generating enzyme required for sulfatase activity [Flavobacterium granuli]SHH33667.1 Formylglycine-generating enzyme, required for sulfatase activity, contains SUMF1/FGE domain [Flavobacterium granuli]